MQHTQIVTVDDLDGNDVPDGQAEAIVFSLNGAFYEIDLRSRHADELREGLARFIAAGRRISPPSPKVTNISHGRRQAGGVDPGQNVAIRRWANEHGVPVSLRGRIAASVVDAYNEAHRSAPQRTTA